MTVEWFVWLATLLLSVGSAVTHGRAVGRGDPRAAAKWAAYVCAFLLVDALNDLLYRNLGGFAVLAIMAGIWLALTRRHVRNQSPKGGGLMTLTYEIREAGSSLWYVLGDLIPNGWEGCAPDISQGRFDLVLFRCDGDESVITIADGGGERVSRWCTRITGRRRVATLRSDGETFERDMVSDRGLIYRARWTHHAI